MKHYVVIGNGMVGSRFVEELVAADDEAFVTVLGKEDVDAYNRVLLSSVVAGTKSPELLSIAPPVHPRVRVLTGVGAARIDRKASLVVDDNGQSHPYSGLVIASGSAARIPAIQGVADPEGLVHGAFVLKDMADAQGIVAYSGHAKRAVVLGAGVLGLEVATGLAARGVSVRIVHLAERIMERQLGWEASAVAEVSLRKMGIESHVGASIAGVQTTKGRVHSVRLEDGSEVLTDMLIMCCGTIPETGLARKAGLKVDRGIVVDNSMATEDPYIYAIGDCAQPPEGSRGLVAQGWDQASRLVATLTGTRKTGASSATSDVVRVKAPGMAMVAMGVCGDFDRSDPRYRVLSLKDPDGARYVEVVVSGGRLVGATCMGDATVAATLSALYTRSMPVPSDPAQLMIRALSGSAASVSKAPADLDDDDKVCNCNTVTAGAIRTAVSNGCHSIGEVAGATRATTGCGDCTVVVQGLIDCTRDTAIAAKSGS